MESRLLGVYAEYWIWLITNARHVTPTSWLTTLTWNSCLLSIIFSVYMNDRKRPAQDPIHSVRCAKQQRTALFNINGETQSPASAAALSTRWKRIYQEFKELGRDTLLLIRGECPSVFNPSRFTMFNRSRRAIRFSFNFSWTNRTAARIFTNTFFLTWTHITYIGCCSRHSWFSTNYTSYSTFVCCITRFPAAYKSLR